MQYASFGDALFYVAAAAFVISLAATIVPLRRRIRPA
jgi:ABC-type lipoprotein release transport system permease subunit